MRAVPGAAMALLLALQITGCGQTGAGEDKTTGAAQTETSQTAQPGESQAVSDGTSQTAQPEASEPAAAQGDEAGQGDAAIDFKPGMPVEEGVKAPDFTAELADGTSLTLSELQGKPVIINFWATWCGYCVREMPAFERLKEEFGDQIGIIAVNCGEDADTVKDFAAENGYTFPIALDEEFAISMLYPTNAIPYTVIVDGEGKVTHVSSGAADADTMYERYKKALGV